VQERWPWNEHCGRVWFWSGGKRQPFLFSFPPFLFSSFPSHPACRTKLMAEGALDSYTTKEHEDSGSSLFSLFFSFPFPLLPFTGLFSPLCRGPADHRRGRIGNGADFFFLSFFFFLSPPLSTGRTRLGDRDKCRPQDERRITEAPFFTFFFFSLFPLSSLPL